MLKSHIASCAWLFSWLLVFALQCRDAVAVEWTPVVNLPFCFMHYYRSETEPTLWDGKLIDSPGICNLNDDAAIEVQFDSFMEKRNLTLGPTTPQCKLMIKNALCQVCHAAPITSATSIIGGTTKPIVICDSRCGFGAASIATCERLTLLKYVPGSNFKVCCN